MAEESRLSLERAGGFGLRCGGARSGEKLLNVGARPQPDHRIGRERLRPVATAAEVRAERPGEQRLASPYRSTQRLAVLVPELLAAAYASERPPDQAQQPDPDRQVEPDDYVRRANH